jgi:hypothetical protein
VRAPRRAGRRRDQRIQGKPADGSRTTPPIDAQFSSNFGPNRLDFPADTADGTPWEYTLYVYSGASQVPGNGLPPKTGLRI